MLEEGRKCNKCGRSKIVDPSTKLFRFPKPGTRNTLKCELWAKYGFPDGKWSSQEFQQKLYSGHKMLCDRHFKRSSFYGPCNSKLLKFAIPGYEMDSEPVFVPTHQSLSIWPQESGRIHDSTMSSDKHCCVPGCKDSGGMHKVLHGFPNPERDIERFRAWLFSIRGDIIGLDNTIIYKYRRVCHAHFEDKYLCRYNKLSKIAVPTLNMSGDAKLKLSSLPEQHKPKESTADASGLVQPEDIADAEDVAELEDIAQPETDEDSNHVSGSENQQEPPSWSSVKDVCRACLSKSGAWDLTETYLTEDGENERLLDMLTLCYGIKLSNVSECSASRFLCDVCAASLRHADSFRRQVRRAEGSFADYYGADDEIKEEYLEDEYETVTEEVCTNDEPMEPEHEQNFSTTLMNTQTSRNISEPSTVNAFPKEQTKPSVDGSTKIAPQNNSMSEVSYSDKYIRVISYSANKNVKNSSVNKEINIESQPAEEFENVEETDNASHGDDDLLFSDIKRRKIDQSKQNVTHPIHTPQPEKSTVLQTVKRDSIDLRRLIKVVNPKKHVVTINPLPKTNPKTMKGKNSIDMNIGESDQNVSNTISQQEKSVKQSVGSNSIEFRQSVKITLPGNKVIKFLPLSTEDAGSVVTKLGGKQMMASGVPVKVDVTKTSASMKKKIRTVQNS